MGDPIYAIYLKIVLRPFNLANLDQSINFFLNKNKSLIIFKL